MAQFAEQLTVNTTYNLSWFILKKIFTSDLLNHCSLNKNRIIPTATCFIALLLSVQVSMAHGFDELEKLPKEERFSKAEDVYAQQLKRGDSAFAYGELKYLISLADKLNDPSLESYAYSMMADKLARTQGYNEQSTAWHLQAIKIARKNKETMAEGIALFKMGRYCYSTKHYPLAIEYSLKANDIFLEAGYDKIPVIHEFLYFMGRIYYDIGDYSKAEFYLIKRTQLKSENVLREIQTYNTLAAMAEEKLDYKKALVNLQHVARIAKTINDTIWQGLASGKIGSIYFKEHRYNDALPYLLAGQRSNAASKIWDEANENVLQLAFIFLEQGDMAEAEKCLDSSRKYLPAMKTMQLLRSIELKNEKLYYEFLVALYQKKGNVPESNKQLVKLMEIKDSLAVIKDLQLYDNIKFRLETEKHLSDVARLEAEAKTSAFRRNAIISILLLSMLTFLLFYNRQRIKRNAAQQLFLKQQALLESEKKRAKDELQNAELRLQDFTENLRQKNELIEKIQEELKLNHDIQSIHECADEREEYFNKLIQSTILTDKDWDEFRNLFDKVHKGFIFRLKEKFSNLTETDTRLLCLIKLQLTRREMANMLGVSQDAIKKARQRLRKKHLTTPSGDDTELETMVVTI